MAAKKTLSNWLTNRYLLIIRNEENFAEKKTISFNYARLILILTLVFFITIGISVYLVTVVFEQWLDPRYTQMKTNRQLVDLTVKLDSLSYEMKLYEQYINNVKLITSGDPTAFAKLDSQSESSLSHPEIRINEKIHPIDSQLRAEFETEGLNLFSYQGASLDEFRELYLFSPIEGIITDGYNPKKDHFGVDIVAKEGEPIVCVADGVVVFSSWTLDSGNVIGVQHRGNLISVYKHNSELLKNVGSFVTGGDIIAIIGNTGELTSGPHLHFELWHNGNSVNPQEYVAF